MKKDYYKIYRVFLILFLLSFSANLFMLTLYFKERKGVPSSLPKESKGIQEVKTPQEAKAPQEVKVPQETETSLRTTPLPFVYVKNKDYFLLCDKQNRPFHFYRSGESGFSLIAYYSKRK